MLAILFSPTVEERYMHTKETNLDFQTRSHSMPNLSTNFLRNIQENIWDLLKISIFYIKLTDMNICVWRKAFPFSIIYSQKGEGQIAS